jgi:hypothetical protein
MTTLLRRTKRENNRTRELRKFFRKLMKTIESQLDQVSPLNRPLTRLPQCIEILLTHWDADTSWLNLSHKEAQKAQKSKDLFELFVHFCG